MRHMKIFIADNHNLVRQGLVSLLNSYPDIKVVGEASNGREALKKLSGVRPDIALIGLDTEEPNGLEVLGRIKKSYPRTKVLILSLRSGEKSVTQAFRSGALGYLPKEAAADELIKAIKTVYKGEAYLSPRVASYVVKDYAAKATVLDAQTLEPRLTHREVEVLQLVAEGKSNSEIASLLNISTKTVAAHRAHLMKKLDIHDAIGLTKYAIRVGLVSVE